MLKGTRHTKAARKRMSDATRRAARRRYDCDGKLARTRELLAADPGQTTVALAAALSVSLPTAAKYRREIEERA